jgi:hypothetical protein
MWGISGLSEEVLASQEDSAACSQLIHLQNCLYSCPRYQHVCAVRCLSAAVSYGQTHFTALFKKLLVSYGACIRIPPVSHTKPVETVRRHKGLPAVANKRPASLLTSESFRSWKSRCTVRSCQSAVSVSVCK